MFEDTTFSFYPVNNFEEIQESIRLGNLGKAKRLLLDGNPSVNDQNVDEMIERERNFLAILDKSFEYSAIGDDGELTAREALLKGIIYGHKTVAEEVGFEPDVWLNPFQKDAIIDWGKSFYPGNISDLEAVFDAFVLQGYLFEVHPTVFAEPHYYFSYDQGVLMEMENSDHIIEFYTEVVEFPSADEHDTTWYKTGLCTGQGSQSSGWPHWPCVGTSCIWFKDGRAECAKGLKFNPTLVEAFHERDSS